MCSGKTLANGASCTLNVTFTATALGTQTGAVTVPTDQVNSPQMVTLTGAGAAANLNYSTTLVYSGTQVGTTSGTQTSTVTNNNSVGATISNVTWSAPFAMASDGCTGVLPANSSCTVTTTFSPIMQGAVTGSLTFTSNALNSPYSILLKGTGTLAAPTFSPAFLQFPKTTVGNTSADMCVQVTNGNPVVGGSNTNIAISSVVTNKPTVYTIDNAYGGCPDTLCSSTLAPTATCSVAVQFTPGVIGNTTGVLTVNDNAATGKQNFSMYGTGG